MKFQHKMGLKKDPNTILLFWPSRLDPLQKGPELLAAVAQKIVNSYDNVQIGIVASGDLYWEKVMGQIACASNGKIAYAKFDEDLSILGYAAAANVFGASLYEPFGQIDVVGNLYGATATNRETGGNKDKISRLRIKKFGDIGDLGNGFLFKDYDAYRLEWGLHEAIAVHQQLMKDPNEYEAQMWRMMNEARKKHSLDQMIDGYIAAYQRINDGKPLL